MGESQGMILELIRLEEDYDFGTFGILKMDKRVFCVTLEPRDELNAQDVSNIPAQQYWCRRYRSERYPNTWEITGVPGRSRVLFHPGNVAAHTRGCIMLAQHFGKLHGDRAILNSGKTFRDFMAITDRVERLHLTITENY
jgi:hypothetical protein